MDTHEQFLNSYHRTFPIRVAVALAAFAGSAALDDSTAVVLASVALTVLYGTWLAAVRYRLLDRVRSDAWIYGLLAVDAVVAAIAVALFGASTPAVALVVFLPVYYALLLGYPGAATAAGLGVVALVLADAPDAAGMAHQALIGIPMLGAVAALAGLIASDRFTEREARMNGARHGEDGAWASKMLASISRIAETRTLQEWSFVVARESCLSTGSSAGLVISPAANGDLGLSVAHDPSGLLTPGLDVDLEIMTAAKACLRDGIPAQFSADSDEGSTLTGMTAPIIPGAPIRGVVCVATASVTVPTVRDLEMLEHFVRLSSRWIPGGAHNSTVPARLENELRVAGRTSGAGTKARLELAGLTLDPASDTILFADSTISLSRSEFDLIYGLAQNAGIVCSITQLNAALDGASALDATMHRLRRKLKKIPGGPRLIKTVRGSGYMMELPSDDAISENGNKEREPSLVSLG